MPRRLCPVRDRERLDTHAARAGGTLAQEGSRARLDRARAAAGHPLGRDASAELALELRRLADLHASGGLSNEEFVAAVRVALLEGH